MTTYEASSFDSSDYGHFVPAYWTQILKDTPIMGSDYEIIDLDDKFIEYLESDGIYLEETQYTSQFSDTEDENYDTDEQTNNEYSILKPSDMFPETHAKIEAAMKRLGGCVVPKLNWTVPKDSVWISANTLKCTSTSEVYQLLKASDRIQADLNLARQNSIPPKLFLRPFVDLRPELEFRAFVMGGNILAISQRNLDIFKEHLKLDRYRICETIENFFEDYLTGFPHSSYAFDVYLSANLNRCYLVDINPLNQNTSTLLFKYDELLEMSESSMEVCFKCIESNEDTRIALCERNFLPVDLFNAESDISKIDFNNLLP